PTVASARAARTSAMAGTHFGSRFSLLRKRTARLSRREFEIPPGQSRQGSILDFSSLCRQAKETRSDGARPDKTQQWLRLPATAPHDESISGPAPRLHPQIPLWRRRSEAPPVL